MMQISNNTTYTTFSKVYSGSLYFRINTYYSIYPKISNNITCFSEPFH